MHILTKPAPAPPDLQETVREAALAAGFAHAGITSIPFAESSSGSVFSAYLERWIESGHAGQMEYLKQRDGAGRLLRSAIGVVAPWARSILLCVAPYQHAHLPLSTDPAPPAAGWIARYAWSGKPGTGGAPVPSDYHRVLLRRLKQLEVALGDRLGTFRSRAYVDTGPVVERAWAQLAGVGWTGKNTCILNEDLGSFFLLGTILTSLEVPETARAALPSDRCGSCTRCIDACPTDALVAPYRMDASRCISYLTLEEHGPVDPALRPGIGRQIAGCDICQDVCPWNAKYRRSGNASPDPEMQARPELVNPSLLTLAALTREQWQQIFFGSPLARVKYERFRRNLAVAMGNSGDPRMIPQLARWAALPEDPDSPDAGLRDAARWALSRIRK